LTDAVVALAPISRMTAAACAALGVSRATVQRRRAGLAAAPAIRRPRPRPARALSAPQRQAVLDVLHAPDFADQAPAEVYATLLDQDPMMAKRAPGGCNNPGARDIAIGLRSGGQNLL